MCLVCFHITDPHIRITIDPLFCEYIEQKGPVICYHFRKRYNSSIHFYESTAEEILNRKSYKPLFFNCMVTRSADLTPCDFCLSFYISSIMEVVQGMCMLKHSISKSACHIHADTLF